jgi:hypothetical protein
MLLPFGWSSIARRRPKPTHDSPAYKALIEKHSYTGPATVFGKNYQADYAPLIGADGKVTGALFVGVAK